jgi:hypothetical protein
MEKNKTYTIHISAEADPRLHAMFRSLGYDTDEFRTIPVVEHDRDFRTVG